MKLYEGIASALADEASGAIFGIMGDGNMSLWAALEAQGRVTMYSARNEAGAVAMADGFFRATGKVGVSTVTCGPGLTQVGTSLVAAERNRSAMVVVIGEIPPGSQNKLQSFDQRRFSEACGVRYFSISDEENAAAEIAEAFFHARVNRCPVVLNLPNDIQERELQWDWEYPDTAAFLPAEGDCASDEALAPLVDALMGAERPVIIAGRGARNPAARDAILRLADRTGALVGTSLQAKGLFDGHAYDVGIAGTFACAPSEALFAEADFVVGVGAELGYYTGEGGLLFPAAEVARIDIAPAPKELGVLPGLYIRGDAARTVERLVALLEANQVQKEGYHTEETRAALAVSEYPMEQSTDGLDPRLLMHELSRALPKNVLVTSGVGHFFGFVGMHLALPPSADIRFVCQFGAIGQAVPTALGIGVGTPDRPHLVIEGDGSLMMHIQELETVARHRVPMVLLVMNDGGYGAEVHKLNVKGFDTSTAVHGSPDFVGVARAFGGDGLILECEEDIASAIKKGFDAGGLFLIDARISPSTVSDAYKKVHMGIPNTTPLPGRLVEVVS